MSTKLLTSAPEKSQRKRGTSEPVAPSGLYAQDRRIMLVYTLDQRSRALVLEETKTPRGTRFGVRRIERTYRRNGTLKTRTTQTRLVTPRQAIRLLMNPWGEIKMQGWPDLGPAAGITLGGEPGDFSLTFLNAELRVSMDGGIDYGCVPETGSRAKWQASWRDEMSAELLARPEPHLFPAPIMHCALQPSEGILYALGCSMAEPRVYDRVPMNVRLESVRWLLRQLPAYGSWLLRQWGGSSMLDGITPSDLAPLICHKDARQREEGRFILAELGRGAGTPASGRIGP